MAEYEGQFRDARGDIFFPKPPPRILTRLDALERAVLSSGGNVTYHLSIPDASGRVDVVLAEIGHPAMTILYNPIVNVIGLRPLVATLLSRSLEGFTVQLFRPDGSLGADFAEAMEFGMVEMGDGTAFGTPGTGCLSTLVVTIPLPITENTTEGE